MVLQLDFKENQGIQTILALLVLGSVCICGSYNHNHLWKIYRKVRLIPRHKNLFQLLQNFSNININYRAAENRTRLQVNL